MKKFISMIMAAAMVVTMVPATAFAANAGTFKVVKNIEVTAAEATVTKDVVTLAGNQGVIAPQLQINLTDVDSVVGTQDAYEFTLKFDGIAMDAAAYADIVSTAGTDILKVYRGTADNATVLTGFAVDFTVNSDADKITVKVTENSTTDLKAGDMIAINLDGVMEKGNVGAKATVKVSGAFGASEEMTFAEVVEKGIKVELDEDVVELAEEEITEIEDIVVKPVAGDDFDDVLNFRYNSVAVDDGTDTHALFTLKVSKGFEFANADSAGEKVQIGTTTVAAVDIPAGGWNVVYADADEIKVLMPTGAGAWTNFVIDNLKVEATTAKPGDVATITVKANDLDSQKVEVAKVIDYTVVMELTDADEDVPVFYSGVDAFNTGLNVEDDHEALSVTIKETFPGAWNHHKAWTLSLPEGVHVVDGVNTGVVATDKNGEWPAVQADFATAYAKGDHETFEFAKRSWPETNPDNNDKTQKVEFVLTLVADPDFEGDVVLKLEGAALDTQEVTIAKFVKPYTVKAEQNDVIIDYRYTEIATDIVVTEAEAGLWAAGLTFTFGIDEPMGIIVFEDDADYAVNEASDAEVDEVANALAFTVTEESDEEPAEVTISGIELFMQRNIPAGPYDLTLTTDMETGTGFAGTGYKLQPLFNPDVPCYNATTQKHEGECIVDDVDDYSTVAKEAFINVVTAGRDQDDNSFTTEVVVPVGETTIYAGEKAITLDVPAYINANGYIMVPVRAVANALGIANDCVQWNQASKTVIIMYGDRLITMTAGSSVIYVGGTPLPSTSSVEIVDGRAFLGLRDLANALGVKVIDWDPVAKVGTLNPKA